MDGIVIDPDVTSERQKMQAALWDDDAFVGRVRRIAKRKGMTLVAVAQAAGVSEAWLRHAAKGSGRSVDYILRVAAVLNTDPALLMGLRARQAERAEAVPAAPTVMADTGSLRQMDRLATASTIAAHLYVALDQQSIVAESDARAALSAVRRVIDGTDDDRRAR